LNAVRRPRGGQALILKRLRDVAVTWYRTRGRAYPWRVDRDPYRRLAVEVLLQRTRADAVAMVWGAFTERFPDAATLASATEEDILLVVKSLGLGRKRSRNLKALAHALVDLDGNIPNSLELASRLPGIGPYSAGAWLATWQGKRVVAIDANVRRIISRVFYGSEQATGERLRVTCAELAKLGPPADLLFGLLDMGAHPCAPRRPKCAECPAKGFCRFAATKVPLGALSQRGIRTTATQLAHKDGVRRGTHLRSGYRSPSAKTTYR
jgi:A/G-specific adenine glycosylase